MQSIKHENAALIKRKWIHALLVFGFFSLISRFPDLYCGDTGYKYFKNYGYKEYNHQAQNWGMVQAPDGIIYVANQGGVLEYDGVTWRIIDMPNDTVLSIAIDKQGTIYIGAKNEIGFLAPDEKGTLKYNSLRSFLPDKKIEFGEVWKTYACEKDIYFHTSKLLFRWDTQKKVMKIWVPQKKFYYSFLCRGRFFVPQIGIGLMEMVDDTLQPIYITVSVFPPVIMPLLPGAAAWSSWTPRAETFISRSHSS